MILSRRMLGNVAAVIALLALTSPLYFDILRTAVFNTTPRDDYAPYLLHIVHVGGKQMGSPYGYRVLSVIVAIPFYFVLPIYHFTKLPSISTPYLRATEALSLVSYLSVVAGGVVQYLLLRRARANQALAACGAFVYILACNFLQLTAVDPV